jgi:hypothetical protein
MTHLGSLELVPRQANERQEEQAPALIVLNRACTIQRPRFFFSPLPHPNHPSHRSMLLDNCMTDETRWNHSNGSGQLDPFRFSYA